MIKSVSLAADVTCQSQDEYEVNLAHDLSKSARLETTPT